MPRTQYIARHICTHSRQTAPQADPRHPDAMCENQPTDPGRKPRSIWDYFQEAPGGRYYPLVLVVLIGFVILDICFGGVRIRVLDKVIDTERADQPSNRLIAFYEGLHRSGAAVAATEGVFRDRIRVLWRRQPDAVGYGVYRSDSPGRRGEHHRAVGNSTEFDDFDLQPGKTYWYTINAVYSELEGNTGQPRNKNVTPESVPGRTRDR